MLSGYKNLTQWGKRKTVLSASQLQ